MSELLTNKPKHVAMILDGNGRWANKRNLPRIAGHRAGLEAMRRAIRACHERGIEVLTLFAFSSENWTRPPAEVKYLMQLFLRVLRHEINNLHQNNIHLRFIGNNNRYSPKLRELIISSQELTKNNTGLKLIIAADYGGRWDIVQATNKIIHDALAQKITPDIDHEIFGRYLCSSDLPEPDLLIRTSGEQRISNFLLWQMAYTELFFTPILWPDFDAPILDEALHFYANRERRFGRVNPHKNPNKNKEVTHA